MESLVQKGGGSFFFDANDFIRVEKLNRLCLFM